MYTQSEQFYKKPSILMYMFVSLSLLLLTCSTDTMAVLVADKTHSTTKAQDESIINNHMFTSSLPEHGLLRSVTGNGWSQCDSTVTQWSGYFDIPGKKSNKHYFYWAFGPRNQNTSAPVMLWLTGGPGCSSSLASFMELGPCQLTKEGDIINNTYSWNNEAYLIFVDQPAGVGFSYSDEEEYDHNESEVSEDMFHFLQAFFDAHEELRHNPFFITGESYAGHYAPAIAHRVMTGNNKKEGHYLNLTGVAIGNGWTDPYYHFGSYAHFAHDYCEERLGKSCVRDDVFREMVLFTPMCEAAVQRCNNASADSSNERNDCNDAKIWCNIIFDLYEMEGMNPYDIRMNCSDKNGCYDYAPMIRFLNRPDVQKSLGVDNMTWQECNMDVYNHFAIDFYKNFNYTIPELLHGDIRVMTYAGDMDFICNYIGDEAWVLRLDWDGHEDMLHAPTVPFRNNQSTSSIYVGTIKSIKSHHTPIHFSFVRIFDAGHMVPMDQPVAAYTMIHNFINNKQFV